MLWDALQEYEIWQLRNRAILSDSNMEAHHGLQRDRAERTEDQVHKVLLLTEAMWELVADRLGLTIDDLVAKMEEIDRADGAADGRRVEPPQPCSSCGAMVAASATSCQFCGAAAPERRPFTT